MEARHLVGFDELIDGTAERPVHRTELVEELLGHLEHNLSELVGPQDPPAGIVISKSRISELSSCENVVPMRRRMPFSRKEKAAFGVVVDEAITIALGIGAPAADAVARALDEVRARGGGNLAGLVDGLAPASRDAFVSEAEGLVAGLLVVWPDVPRSSVKSQVKLKVRLLGGAVVLVGVPDLIIGSLRGQAGVSQALVLDWKTGGMRSDHVDEQHFYGLLAALAGGVVPPWRVATYYLGSQSGIYDEVSEEHLFEAADQVVAAVRARRAIAPVLRGSGHRVEPACAWSDRVVAPEHALGLDDLEARRSSRVRAHGSLHRVGDTASTSGSGRPDRQLEMKEGTAIDARAATSGLEAGSIAGDPGAQPVSRREAAAAAESNARSPGPGMIELLVGRLDEVIGVYFLEAFTPPVGEVVVDLVESDILRARCRQLLGELVVAAVELRYTDDRVSSGVLHAVRSARQVVDSVA
jgi:hypothetical protein